MSGEPVGGLTSAQVCAAAGVTYRQLDSWCRVGLVTPSGRVAAGYGSRRLWTAADVAVVRRLGDASRRRRATLAELVAV